MSNIIRTFRRHNMRYFPIIALLFATSGCSFINLGSTSVAEKAPEEMHDQIDKLHNDRPPIKSQTQQENERKAVAMARLHVDEAKDISTEQPVKLNLTTAQELLDALERSMGTPTQEVVSSVDAVEKLIKSMDAENKKLKEKEEEYQSLMDENRQTIARLQGLVSTKIKRESTLLDKIEFWFWIAIIASIALAVFVPGGMFLVNRFWSKVGEMVVSGATTTVRAVGDMSHSIGKYAETLNDDERRRLKQYLRSMSNESQGFWDEVRQGRNPMAERIYQLPKRIRKKFVYYR